MDSQQQIHDLKVQLATLQGNHKETMDQLGEKSRMVVSFRTELDKSGRQNENLTEEVRP